MFEVALALGGMLLGVAVLLVLGALGLVPTEGALGRGFGFAAGPGITLVGVLFYRWAAGRFDEMEVRSPDASVDESASSAHGSGGRALGWAGLGVVAAIGGSFILGQLMTVFGIPVAEQSGILAITEAAKRGEDLVAFGMLAVAATIAAPIVEEWLFRGLLFARVHRRGLRPEAYVLSAAAFAAIHTNPAGFVVYLWLGLVFAETLRRTGRLWVAVLVHMGNNAFALATLMWG